MSAPAKKTILICSAVALLFLFIWSLFFQEQLSFVGKTTWVAEVNDGSLFLGRWYDADSSSSGWRFVHQRTDPYADEIFAFGGFYFLGALIHPFASAPYGKAVFVVVPLWMIALLVYGPLAVLAARRFRNSRRTPGSGFPVSH